MIDLHTPDIAVYQAGMLHKPGQVTFDMTTGDSTDCTCLSQRFNLIQYFWMIQPECSQDGSEKKS